MSHTDRRSWLCALCMSLLSACVANPAPRHWLATPDAAAEDVYGAWITITLPNDSVVAGEFLAYGRDTVWVLPLDGRVLAIRATDVKKGRIAWYDSQYGNTALLGALGGLSTLSHGILLGVTAPMWMIAGTAAAASDSRAPGVDPNDVGWVSARAYARYPMGLPDGLPPQLPVKSLAPRQE